MPQNSQIRNESQTRQDVIVVRQGLLASDPQHVWQLAAQKAQELVGTEGQVVNVQLVSAGPAASAENSTDKAVAFTFQVLH